MSSSSSLGEASDLVSDGSADHERMVEMLESLNAQQSSLAEQIAELEEQVRELGTTETTTQTHEMDEDESEDEEEEIVGRMLRFTNFANRPIIAGPLNFDIKRPPEEPFMDTTEADKHLVQVVGMVSPHCPPLYSNDTFSVRAFTEASFKILLPNPANPNGARWMWCAWDGTRIKYKHVWFDSEYRDKDYQYWEGLYHTRCRLYEQAMAAARIHFAPTQRAWVQERKEWEWNIVQKARNDPNIQWPRGISREEIEALTFETAITSSEEPPLLPTDFSTDLTPPRPGDLRIPRIPRAKASFERAADWLADQARITNPVADDEPIPTFYGGDSVYENSLKLNKFIEGLGFSWEDIDTRALRYL
ncbi:uncharacterized protein DSM5745_06993 [Aspergillus mulundensis]|uniref:Uncharacterized protein n=1 Tax=Aspergillus mulundensis TaxID=1810919 RepID=A0A3D8RKH8_9EURO|nr:hypothetical protein DSM5745_06993 [Aspergillus mulundensis]RDW74331.1 hypothetical protein DSM5745_06993 [Aspergillus mulundensis]